MPLSDPNPHLTTRFEGAEMPRNHYVWSCLLLWGLTLMQAVWADEGISISGAPCTAPPVLHCPDNDCPAAVVINPGPVVETQTRRTYFLDYPCDLKKGEKVTFVLSLHGGGSYGNWQRHYFPLMDYKDKYRLVVATPNSPTRVWSEVDDQYLQNIVGFVIDQLGRDNIKAFWLVGHSQGGMTSNRIVRNDFFKTKVDGWLSLSGGRLGEIPRARQRLHLRLRAMQPAPQHRRARARWHRPLCCASCRARTSLSSMKPGNARSMRVVSLQPLSGLPSSVAGHGNRHRTSSICVAGTCMTAHG
jgi:hypothetical protein